MKHFLIFLQIVFIFFSGSCMYAQGLRKEIETKYLSDEYYLVPVGEQGIIAFSETGIEKDNSKKKWVFTKYDTDFNEGWTTEYSVPKNMYFVKYYNDGDGLYILMKYGYEYEILNLNVVSGDIKFSYGKSDYAFSTVTDFKVLDKVAYIGGDRKPHQAEACLKSCFSFTCLPWIIPPLRMNMDAFIVINHLEAKKSIDVPLFLKKESIVTNIELDNEKKEAYALVKAFVGNSSVLFLKEIDINGHVLKTSLLTPGYKNELIDGKLTIMNESEKILVGSWGGRGAGAQGVYFAKLLNDKQQYIKQYSFTDFKNFFNYLSAFRKSNMKEKVASKKAHGKDLKLNYNLLVHDIIQRGNEYIMVAEAYYSEYRTESYYVADANGGHWQTRSVFVGYRYSHAVIAAFSKDGDLLWDNCFEIWNVLSKRLKERVKVIASEDNIVLAYSYKGEINYKVINANSVVEDKKHIPIKTDFSSDKITHDYDPELEYWYGNYFIAYGTQRIKNKTDEKKRTVFYLNKVEF